jgi:hypothetical protein
VDVKRVDLHDGQTTSTQRKDTNMKVTLDQVIAADALGYAAAIEQAIADAKGDPNKLTEAINTVNTVRVNVAQGKQDAADAARIERVNASKAAADALRTHILDVFTRVWKDNKFDVQLAAISVDANVTGFDRGGIVQSRTHGNRLTLHTLHIHTLHNGHPFTRGGRFFCPHASP